jgi:hypothetical protein
LYVVKTREEKCIFEYDGAGFNETVYWNIEWISEDAISSTAAMSQQYLKV